MKQQWRPECVMFVGLQASGTSSFYHQRFWRTHVRINLDMLKTRRREALLLQACIEMQQSCVVDNTNPTVADRSRYIVPARAAGFRVVGYFFHSELSECLVRNQARDMRERVPARGIAGTAKRLVPPSFAEGIEQLYCAKLTTSGMFEVVELIRS